MRLPDIKKSTVEILFAIAIALTFLALAKSVMLVETDSPRQNEAADGKECISQTSNVEEGDCNEGDDDG